MCPLGEAAKKEARQLMLASHNLLKPASGEPIVEPTKDDGARCVLSDDGQVRRTGEGKGIFTPPDEVALAYDLGHVGDSRQDQTGIAERGKSARGARKLMTRQSGACCSTKFCSRSSLCQ